jgi:phage FluMu protein Com
MKCRLKPWELDSLRASLDRDEPGWTEHRFWCYGCRVEHVLTPSRPQGRLLPAAAPLDGGRRTWRTKTAEPAARADWCVQHGTASRELTAPCAYCDKPLHVHQDALGAVKSGREGRGYLVEQCPRCGQPNAVQPVYGKYAIRTARLEDGAPVLQLTLGRIG